MLNSNIAQDLHNGNGHSAKIDNFLGDDIHLMLPFQSIEKWDVNKCLFHNAQPKPLKPPKDNKYLSDKIYATHKIGDWKEAIGVDNFLAARNAGIGTRLCVKAGGNKKENITLVGGFYVDADSTGYTIGQLLESELGQYVACWQPSASFEGEISLDCDRYHAHFFFDDLVGGENREQFKEILTHIHKVVFKTEIDKSKFDELVDPGRVEFGSLHKVQEVNLHARFPFKKYLEAVEDVKENSQDSLSSKASIPPTASSGGITEQVLKYIAEVIWKGVCNRDPNKLFCLWEHQLVDNSDELEKGQLYRYVGKRYRSDNPDGRGLVVSCLDDSLPPMYFDRNQAYNFLQYWFNCKKEKGLKTFQEFNLKRVVDDICRTFKVPPFEFKGKKESKGDENKKLLDDVNEILDTYVRLIKAKGKDIFMYYDMNAHVWMDRAEPQSVWQHCVKPALFGIGVGDSEAAISTDDSFFINYIKNYERYQYHFTMVEFDKLRDFDVIPLADGEFNRKTCEFIPEFHPDVYNMSRFNYPYAEGSEDSEGMKLLNGWLGKMYSDDVAEAIKAWVIANVHGVAHQTRRMLNVYGTPNTGKTVIGNLIINILGDNLSISTTGSKIKESSRFALQRLDSGVQSFFIDEFNKAPLETWQMLKEMSGSSEMRVEVEKKFMPSNTVLVRCGVTTASQDNIRLPNSDDGGIRRRVVLIRHTQAMINPEFEDIDNQLKDPKICSDIFYWCLHQNGDEAVKKFIAYAKSECNKDEVRMVLKENDNVLQFMTECLEFTNEPTDTMSNLEVQNLYSVWLEAALGEDVNSSAWKGKIPKITQWIREKAVIPDNKFDWKLAPETGKECKIKIDNKWVKGFKGVKSIYKPD